MHRLAIAVILTVAMLTACATPNPGQLVVSCTMDAVNDPQVVAAVMAALGAPNFAAALASLLVPAGKVTAEVLACILKSVVGNTRLGAEPGGQAKRDRARMYLVEHGYVVAP